MSSDLIGRGEGTLKPVSDAYLTIFNTVFSSNVESSD